MGQGASAPMDNPTIGYHKIRGLAAPLRMMCYYKGQKFENVSYGADLMKVWFEEEKPKLLEKNSCINLPYIIDGDTVVTQSNSCFLYLGSKLGIDKPADFLHNHMALDEIKDTRDALMDVVYCTMKKSTEKFEALAEKQLTDTAAKTFKKLDGFCKGVYMCGDAPQSADFHIFEMIDQHKSIASKLGKPDPIADLPKLQALYAAMLAEPMLKKYFESDFHLKYSQNNGLFTDFTGQPWEKGADEYGPTVREQVTP